MGSTVTMPTIKLKPNNISKVLIRLQNVHTLVTALFAILCIMNTVNVPIQNTRLAR